MAEHEDRTEAATPHRLAKAREDGKVATSRELASLAGFCGAVVALLIAAPATAVPAALRLRGLLADAGQIPGPAVALRTAMEAAALLALPVACGVLLAAVATGLLQTGMLFHPAAMLPDLSRLDPRRGLRRSFGPDGLQEALRALVKLGLLAAIGFFAFRALLPLLTASLSWTPATLFARIFGAVLHLMLMLAAGQAAIALADVAWTRIRHARSLRMSRDELRREAKENDGDPHVKQRRRALRMQRARRRMLAAVPKAAVVVTNPTHYAVALAYERGGGGAPRVVAKGADDVAARIREVARANRVPLVANPPLARALYRVELDAEIPAEHFKAVAEVIAYVWRLGQRVRPAPPPS